MFMFKKIAAPFLFPVPLILGFLAVGLILLWFTQRQKTGKILVSIGTLFLLLFSLESVSNYLVGSLESRYPPVLSAANDVKWIVVLDGGHASDPRLPPTSQLHASTLARLVEGIRLYRKIPGSKLILSGGKVFSRTASAGVMSSVAQTLGVNADDLILEPKARDTREEARYVRPLLKAEKFFLVTSASHMPRSVLIFKGLGMNPIPAPADYLNKKSGVLGPGIFQPSAYNLMAAERTFYEYIAITWFKLSGPTR